MSGIEALNLNLLRVFVAVYETGNVTRAAEQLGMSQPTVSGNLARLNAQLGQTMFDRSRNGVAPTAAARRLIQPIQDALHAFSSGLIDVPEAQSNDATRHFRIALQNLAEPTMCGHGLDELARKLPNVTIEIVPPFSVPLEQELLGGTLDLAFHLGQQSPVDHPDIIVRNTGASHWACITRKGWSEKYGPLTRESLEEAGRVVLQIEREVSDVPILYDSDTIPTPPRCQTGQGWNVLNIVNQSDLVAAVPLSLAASLPPSFELDLHPIPYPYKPVPMHIMWHKRSQEDAIHQQLMSILIGAGAKDRARIREKWKHLIPEHLRD